MTKATGQAKDTATVITHLDAMMAEAAELEAMARETGDREMIEQAAVLRQDAYLALRDEVRQFHAAVLAKPSITAAEAKAIMATTTDPLLYAACNAVVSLTGSNDSLMQLLDSEDVDDAHMQRKGAIDLATIKTGS